MSLTVRASGDLDLIPFFRHGYPLNNAVANRSAAGSICKRLRRNSCG